MNSTKSLVLLALFATAISAGSCPGPVIIKSFTTYAYTEGSDVTATVGSGYKLIGGGFTSGELLRESYPSSSTDWTINTSPVTADVGPAPNTAYAIGLYDPDNCWTVQTVTAGPFGQGQSTGSGSATCPSGTTLVGGGASSDSFLNTNYPNTIRGDATSAFTWTASFNPADPAFVGPSQTGLTVYALCLRPTGSYTAGNFISNSVGSSAYDATSSNYLQIVGGGYLINGQYGAATNSYNTTSGWESTAQTYQGTSIQSLSIGLAFSAAQTSPPVTSAPTNAPTTSPSKSCSGQIITTPRSSANSGSWTSGNTFYQIYDFTVQNTGECPIIRATYGSIFTGPNNPGVSQQWNVGQSPSGDQVLGSVLNLYGNSIPAGGSRTGFGVVVYNATGVTGVAHGPTTFCDASCTNSA